MSKAGIFKDPHTGSYYFSPDVIQRAVSDILTEHRLDSEYARLAHFVVLDLLSAALDADGVPPLQGRAVHTLS